MFREWGGKEQNVLTKSLESMYWRGIRENGSRERSKEKSKILDDNQGKIQLNERESLRNIKTKDKIIEVGKFIDEAKRNKMETLAQN